MDIFTYEMISIDFEAGTFVLKLNDRLQLNFNIPINELTNEPFVGKSLDEQVAKIALGVFIRLIEIKNVDFRPIQPTLGQKRDITAEVEAEINKLVVPAAPEVGQGGV